MNPQKNITIISDFFKHNNMDYAIIGAFALFSYGYIRATKDIDFVTRIEYKEELIAFLDSLGYETLFSSNAFSNHMNPVDSHKVDVMYVEKKTAKKIFKAVKDRIIINDIKMPVISIEHFIAMKLFAIQNNPDRKYKDLADIKEILKNEEFDKKIIYKYFQKYGMESYFNSIVGE